MDYRFKPISKVCAGTGEPLVPGTSCYSVLVEKDGAFERLDYSEEGWTGVPEGGVGYWRAIVPEPVQKHAATIDPESLMTYFEEICEDSNPQQAKVSYVLALHLLQKRRLILEGTVERDGSDFLLLNGSRGEGPFHVRDQQLSNEEISQLQSHLSQQITSEWNAA